MFRRHIAHRLLLGRFLGIDLFIHWSFWLLLIGIGAYSLSSGEGIAQAGLQMLQIVALFTCVTLHEYGHAMMARLFKIRTVDITLLPIGGLARLERMPRVPWQELLVAIAGPAVNVVIAVLVAIGLFVGIQNGWITSIDGATLEQFLGSALTHPLGWLLVMNISLVVFNMIPAFPMDGGRVLRALLAMVFEYRIATQAAAKVGFVAAVALGLYGVWNLIPVVALISLFIGYAGWAEARQVEMVEAVRGVRVLEGMVRPSKTVFASDPLARLVDFFSSCSEPSVAVLGVNGLYLGMLDIHQVAQAVAGNRWDLQAANLMDSEAETVSPNGMLERQIAKLDRSDRDLVPIVDGDGTLRGMLDMRSLRSRVTLARHAAESTSQAAEPIMARLVESPTQGAYRDSYI